MSQDVALQIESLEAQASEVNGVQKQALLGQIVNPAIAGELRIEEIS